MILDHIKIDTVESSTVTLFSLPLQKYKWRVVNKTHKVIQKLTNMIMKQNYRKNIHDDVTVCRAGSSTYPANTT